MKGAKEITEKCAICGSTEIKHHEVPGGYAPITVCECVQCGETWVDDPDSDFMI